MNGCSTAGQCGVDQWNTYVRSGVVAWHEPTRGRTITALRSEHDTLAGLASTLTDDQLATTSGAAEWTAGRETSERIEARTDELAAPPYDTLTADELDELIAGLEPIAAAAQAVDD